MIASKRALLIIDMQNDFLEGGSLEVREGINLVPLINEVHKNFKWDKVILSADWHPQDHCSFFENNPGSELFKPFYLEETGVEQVMWPAHCIQDSYGAKFDAELEIAEDDVIVKKGTIRTVDSYSAFGKEPEDTGLADLLKAEGITEVYVCGVAFDYCVGNTALDALLQGLKTYVVWDLTKSVAPETEKEMKEQLTKAGGEIIDLKTLAKHFDT